jgi:hypothetical protein
MHVGIPGNKAEHQQIPKIGDVQHALAGVGVDKFAALLIGPFIFILSQSG